MGTFKKKKGSCSERCRFKGCEWRKEKKGRIKKRGRDDGTERER